MKNLRKLICIILTLVLVLACAPVSFADDDSDDPFSGDYKEFPSGNGTVTQVYDNGSVMTCYPDGTREAVDFEGTHYSKDAEGTTTISDVEGNVAKEYADGTRELVNADGTKETYNTDGSYVKEYRSGLCEKTNPDGSSAFYFEGGEGMLKNDGLGYENGTITGPNGEILSSSDKGIALIGKDGTQYNYSYGEDDNDSMSIVRPDGTSVEAGPDGCAIHLDGAEARSDLEGNMYWTFEDGGTMTLVDGVIKIVAPDGSYQIKDTKSEYFDCFNAENGSRMLIDKDGEVEELKLNADGFRFDYSDGRLKLLQDDENGLYIITNPDGTAKVYTSDTSYTLSPSGLHVDNDGYDDDDRDFDDDDEDDDVDDVDDVGDGRPYLPFSDYDRDGVEKGLWKFKSVDTGYTRESYTDSVDAESYDVHELEHYSVFEYYLTTETQHGEFVCKAERPPKVIPGGSILNLSASAHGEGGGDFFTVTASYAVAYIDTDPDSLQGSYLFRTPDGRNQIQVYSMASNGPADDQAVFSKEMPVGRNDGEEMVIFFSTSGQYTRWVYYWDD